MSDQVHLEIADLKKTLESEFRSLREEVSRVGERVLHVGAANDVSWIGFAFTITYVLLGFILWRVW
jgi:hypothetical protein